MASAPSRPDHHGRGDETSVIITDDLDGSAGAQTVSFGVDGASYEVDLGAKNRARLETALQPFAADNGAVRAWAKSAGLKVSERGRISAEVLRQYEAAVT